MWIYLNLCQKLTRRALKRNLGVITQVRVSSCLSLCRKMEGGSLVEDKIGRTSTKGEGDSASRSIMKRGKPKRINVRYLSLLSSSESDSEIKEIVDRVQTSPGQGSP